MAETVSVKMLRSIGGYREGATRELSAADAKRLGDRGLVEITGKAAPAPQNKMEPAPQNKADRAPENRRIDPNFLDRSVSAILPDLERKSKAELQAVYDAERHGKTRKSLMAPLKDMIAAAE
jgi:hypothetical protein